MVKGIIFDKDGTLFDFNATWGAWARGMMEAEAGGDAAMLSRLADALGYDLTAGRFLPGSIVIASTAEEFAGSILEITGQKDRHALLSRLNAATADVTQVEAVPLLPYFNALKARHYRLGIVTNDAEVPARKHLASVGVTDCFDFIAGYDSGYGAKPAPGQLLAFCRSTGLSPDDCLMVGDSTHDLHAGRSAGMRTIGVLTGPAPVEELSPFADIVLPDIGAIPRWLTGQNFI